MVSIAGRPLRRTRTGQVTHQFKLWADQLFAAKIWRIDGIHVDKCHAVVGATEQRRGKRSRKAAAHDGDINGRIRRSGLIFGCECSCVMCSSQDIQLR